VATITVSAGTSSSRDFNTLGGAAAALAGLCGVGDTYRVELYNDGIMTESNVSFNVTSLGSSGRFELVAAEGQEHYGVIGNGFIWRPTKNTGTLLSITGNPATYPSVLVQGFTIDRNEVMSVGNTTALQVIQAVSSFSGCVVNRMIVRGLRQTANEILQGITVRPRGSIVENCLVFDFDSTTGASILVDGENSEVSNCTVYGIASNGIDRGFTSCIIRNCAVFDCGIDIFGGWHASSDYNATSDTTALGSHSLTNRIAADEFVNSAGLDFNLWENSSLIGRGIYGINTYPYDISRTLRTNPTDIGAYMYIVPQIEITSLANGLTRFRIRARDIDWAAESYNWQIRIANEPSQPAPYPLNLYTDEPEIDVFLIQYVNYEVRVRQIGVRSDNWFNWTSVPDSRYNSFERYRILSGQEVLSSTSQSTSEGITITNS